MSGERPDPDELLARAERGLREAARRGAPAAEVFLWSATSLEAVRGGRVRTVQRSDRSGVSVRVPAGEGYAVAKSSGLRDEDIAHAARLAADAAAGRAGTGDPAEAFPPPPDASPRPTAVDPRLDDPDPARLLALADAVTEAARRDARIDHHMASVTSHGGLFAVANSRGLRAWDRGAHESLGLDVRAASAGSAQRLAHREAHERGPLDAAVDAAQVGRDAVAWAVAALDARPLDAPQRDVLLDAACATQVLFGLLPSLAGRAAAAGRSRFHGRLGEPVASRHVTIRDEPTSPGGCRNQRVDDEGVPTAPRVLLEKGVLRGFLYDWASARAERADPTGHGLRPLTGRYAGAPRTRAVNAVVEPGSRPLEDLVRDVDHGVLVRGTLLGGFTKNPLTGDMSSLAPLAFLVRRGEVRHALPPAALGGNVFDAARDVVAVGADAERFPRGSCAPLWTRGLTCST